MQLHPDLNPRGRNEGGGRAPPTYFCGEPRPTGKPRPQESPTHSLLVEPRPLTSEVSLLSPFCFHPPSHPPSYAGRKEVGERAGHWARSRVSGGLSHLRLRPAPHHLRALGDRGRGVLLGHPAPAPLGEGLGFHTCGAGAPRLGDRLFSFRGALPATEPQSASGTFCLLSGAPRPGGTRGLPSPPEEVQGPRACVPGKTDQHLSRPVGFGGAASRTRPGDPEG